MRTAPKLAPLLVHQVPMRVMLHQHVGFNELVPVNRMVPELLSVIPGVQGRGSRLHRAGIHVRLFRRPAEGARRTSTRTRVRAARTAGAEAVVTIFHQCYREIVGLDAAGAIPVYNYIQLIARSMGLPYEDEYKAWKRAGEGAAALIGAERIAKVGIAVLRARDPAGAEEAAEPAPGKIGTVPIWRARASQIPPPIRKPPDRRETSRTRLRKGARRRGR